MSLQLLTVENQSSLSPHDAAQAVYAVAYQLAFHFNRSPWVTRRFAPAGHAMLLAEGAAPPKGSWNMVLLDEGTEPGTLGYHADADGTGIPFCDVFVKGTVAAGKSVTSVLSHECIETLGDPDTANPATARNDATGQTIVRELCDACEGFDYDFGAPEGRVTGVTVSDFLLPAYFGLEDPAAPSSTLTFRDSLHTPFELGPEGYATLWPSGEHLFGAERTVLPAWASRLPRIKEAC